VTAAGPVIPNFGHGSACVTGDYLFCWDWVRQHWGDTLEPHLVQHVELTLIAVSIGFAIALALALLTHRVRSLDHPIAITAGLIYTIPSLVAFQILIAY
jgi:osmoprotectant transport system permease protein